MLNRALSEVYDEVKGKYELLLPIKEQKLPADFIAEYSGFISKNKPNGYSKVTFNEHTAVIITSTGKQIYLSNEWFYLAAAITDFFKALVEYREEFIAICSGMGGLNDIAKELKGLNGSISNIRQEILDKIDSRYIGDKYQADNLKGFITDYSGWGGAKTIDRDDYYVSAIMKITGVLQETQSGIAEIANQFHNNPSLATLLHGNLIPAIYPQVKFKLDNLHLAVEKSGLQLNNDLLNRFVGSLCAKSFVILTGLSGSGKTKLAQAFASWICEDENEQVCLVPVGADWTNREPLLGYPNALNADEYVKPDNKVIQLLISATANEDKPYFLILDEMNLSHVERYFADFLSTMESGKAISLHSGQESWDDVPPAIRLPKNLFIIGTVNVDETTYMFSPKVLDRANVLDFRVSKDEMELFLKNPAKPDLTKLEGAGAGMAADFVRIAKSDTPDSPQKDEINRMLLVFFAELNKTGAEFGYRTASEIHRLAALLHQLTKADGAAWSVDQVIDSAVIQKLLPKVHGSRSKLEPVLTALAACCLKDVSKEDSVNLLNSFEKGSEDIFKSNQARFKLSLEKILRMRKRVVKDGFTSFAEA